MSIYALRYISNDVRQNATSNVYKFSPNSQGEVDAKGVMHSLITVIGQDGIQAERISKFVWDTLVDTYYYTQFSTVIDTLKNAVEQGGKKAGALIKNDNNGDINLSFAIAVFKGRGVYLTVFGEQQVYVYKNGGIVKVSQIITQNKGVVASMAWSDSDLIILASPTLLEGINDIITLGDSNEEVVKKLANVSTKLNSYESVVILSNVDYEQKKVKKEEVIQAPRPAPLFPKPQEPEIKEEIVERNIESVTEDEVEVETIENEVEVLKPKEKKKIDLSKVKGILSNAKGVVSKASPVVGKVLGVLKKIPDFIFSMFSKIFQKLNVVLLDKYGRTQWYKRIMSKISLSNFGRRRSGVGMKIDGYKEVDTRKKRFAILFFVIFGVAVVFGLVRLGTLASNQRKENKQAAAILQTLDERVDLADKQRLTDREMAQTTMFTIIDEDLIGKLDGMKLSDADNIKYGTVKNKYYEIDDALNNRVRVDEDSGSLEVFLDGRAEFGEGVNLTDITTYKDEFQSEFLIAVDNGNKAVYRISLDNKSVKTLGGEKVFSSPKYIDYGIAGMYVYDDVKGMLRARFSKSGTVGNFSVIPGLDKDVLGEFTVSDLAIITATDNVYLLSPEKSAIYRAIGSSVGYQYPTEYITSKSFAKSFNLANDISIYVMTSGDRGVERYSYNQAKGVMALNKITVEGIDGTLGDLTAAYTAALDDSNMFIFDSGLSRILKFEKPVEGGINALHPNQLLLTSQYLYKGKREDTFKNVKEIAADYNEGYLYILDANKILKLKIK